ncbi:MAG: hypothetical protein ABR988_18530 [Terriglobales bacterium]|jgi:hypothetical protein
MKRLCFAIVALLISSGVAQSRPVACRDNPKIVDACYSIRGVLFYANGTPSTRILVVGTKRILGVHDEEDGMPEYISKLIPNFNDEVRGDFVVCPYSKKQSGHMQFVCIDSGKNLKHKVNDSH